MNTNSNDKNSQNPVLESDGRQRGFSLIEIMVALALSLFLITGMIQLLIGNKQSYRVHEAQSRMQENGRFALEALGRDIRMAGFTSCQINKSVTNVLNNPTTWWENFGAGSLVGYDGTQGFTGKAFGTGSADRVMGTDAITVLEGGGQSYSIVSHDSGLSVFTLGDLGALKKGNMILVCSPAEEMPVFLFQINNVNSGTLAISHNVGTVTPGNSTKTLTNYRDGIQTSKIMIDFIPVAFYIGVSTSCTSTPCTSRSLYQMQLDVTDAGVASMTANELVEGVQDMQIVYGEDTNGDGVIDPPYKDASDASVINWSNVLSVRINLLMVSLDDNLATALQTVIFPANIGNANTGGNVYTPSANDRRLRQAFSATVSIRNRLQLR
ncbi:MAG: PilW family protein [Candidatus Contendobacter sp.]|nr:PilW family protein [Candidatus Contendobacter sp.]